MTWTTSAIWLIIIIKSCGHGPLFCSAPRLFSWWRGLHSLTEEKKIANEEESDEADMKEEELYEVKQMPLLYTRAPGYTQRNPRSKMLINIRLVEKLVISDERDHRTRKRLKTSIITLLER